MRPQLLYLLLALTRVAGAWDALLADDGTIDLGGNVVAVAEDPDDLMLNMMDIGEGAPLPQAGARRRPPRQQPATVVDGTRFDDYQSTMLNLLQEAIPERPGRMQARHRRRRVARRHQRHPMDEPAMEDEDGFGADDGVDGGGADGAAPVLSLIHISEPTRPY